MEAKQRKDWQPVVVAESIGRSRRRSIGEFHKGRVMAQVVEHITEDGLRYRTVQVSRLVEIDEGLRTSRCIPLASFDDLCCVVQQLKKWRRDEKRRNRQSLLRRFLTL